MHPSCREQTVHIGGSEKRSRTHCSGSATPACVDNIDSDILVEDYNVLGSFHVGPMFTTRPSGSSVQTVGSLHP